MELLNRLITQNIVINEIQECEDTTMLKVRLCVMDSLPSPNGWCVTKEVLNERQSTLINKPIVCRYYPETNNEFGTDYIGDHEESTITVRGTNGDMVIPYNNTVSIGVITNTEIIPIDESENSEVQLWADGVLWLTKEFNSVSLIHEWAMNNIAINTSVEWGIKDGTSVMVNNVEYMTGVTFTGLCVLNSRNNGIKPVVYGNYQCSNLQFATNEMVKQFNNAIKTDIENIGVNEENKEEGDVMENKFLIALNQLSLGETRDKVMEALSKTLTAEEYNNAWISNYGIYDDYVVYETYVDEAWKNFKVNYSKGENDEITVDLGSKVEMEYNFELVEKQVVNELKSKAEELDGIVNEKTTLEATVSELQEKVNSLTEDLTKTTDEKVVLAEAISTLETKVNELEPYKEKADKDAFETALAEKMSYYETKFNALNGAETFASEDVQQLVKDLLDVEKKDNAKIALDSMLVDLVQPVVTQVNNAKSSHVTEQASDLSNLVPDTIKSDIELYRD